MGKKGIKTEEPEKKKNPLHKDYPLRSNLKFIFGAMLREEKLLRVLIPLGILVSPIMNYLWTFMSKFVIEMITGKQEISTLLLVIALFTCIQICSTMLNTLYWSSTWFRYIGVRMILLTRLNKKIMTIDFEHLENPDVMDAIQKAQNSSGGNDQGIEGMMRTGVDCLTRLAVVAVGMIIMGTLHPLLIVLLCVTAVLSFIMNDRVNAHTKKTIWDVLAPWWRKNRYMNDISTDFKAAKDIRMFHLSDWLGDKMHELNRYRIKMQIKNERNWFFVGAFDNLMWVVSQVGIYALIVYEAVNNSLSVANAFLYVSTAGTFYENMSSVLKNFSNLMQRNREVNDFRSVLDFNGGDMNEGEQQVPECEQYQFIFEHVSFRYPKAEKYALKDLNLTVTPGERLAVVGLNGAGKTTFIKLLLRLYEPTEGTITLNGTNIAVYDKKSYYHLFAPLFQEVELFAFPLAENISMKVPEETDLERVKQCVAISGFEESLKKLPNGLQTEVLKVIDDEGVDFSGGEKQKLALTRALYKNAPIVILDEPTAALDALAEYELYRNFNDMIGTKSAVFISHRLSSTRFCDKVAMFVDGEMMEYGTHESLLEKNGSYAEMFHLQAQYYVEHPVDGAGEVTA